MNNRSPTVPVSLHQLVRAAMFTAIAIGAGFALLIVPNVEFITVIIFIAGVSLGIRWGMIVGGVAEFIFSAMNPVGSGLMFPPLLISQVFSMTIIGMLGGFLRPLFWREKFLTSHIVLAGLAGFGMTFIYDTCTSLAYPISAGFSWQETLGIYFSGMLFLVVHHVSNTVVFLVGVPLVIPKIVPIDA